MPDWAKSMQQTFEFYSVDPYTWGNKERIKNIEKATIKRDLTVKTLGSATFDTHEDIGEKYIRPYLVTIQNGIEERLPMGTYLVQTPSTKFDGRRSTVTMDAYTPLLELKDSLPPIGYTVMKNEEIMDSAYMLTKEHLRAPVVAPSNTETLTTDFVADPKNTWLEYLIDLVSRAKYHYMLDEMGRVLFMPDQTFASLQPVMTFNDDNSSILLPELTLQRDLYGIPNVVEVVYSDSGQVLTSVKKNEDKNSPISIQNRGREIWYRDTDPKFSGTMTQEMVDEYATSLLEQVSCLEYTVTFSHGYYPVNIGDAVRLNYRAAGLNDVKAMVISQTINCVAGCTVETTAKYTKKLWERE